MARTITFDFATGGVATEGRVTMAGTNIYTTGTTVNLPPIKVAYLAGGLASIPNVEPTPVAADGWRYQVKLESNDGSVAYWLVEVPDLTTPVGLDQLPTIESTAFPIGQTGMSIETWLESVRAQAAAANANALLALEAVNLYLGPDGEPLPFKAVDTWDQKKVVAYADGTVKAIPYADMPPGQPPTPTPTPGSTMIRVSWVAAAPATTSKLLRNGVVIFDGVGTLFTDKTVVPGATYTYQVITYDQWGQRSLASGTATGAVDPALNLAPVVQVTTWPAPLPANGSGIIRVCGRDAEAQSLALTLGVSVGTIAPTQDPSIWTFTV